MPIPQHAASAKVDRAGLRATLRDDRTGELADATNAEIDRALASVDQDALYDQERAGWVTEVWDRTSPINGVSAQHFLDRDDVPDEGDIYLVRQGDRVVIFQPHDPDTEGIAAIPAGEGEARGVRHADTVAAGRAAAQARQQAIEHIRAARAGT